MNIPDQTKVYAIRNDTSGELVGVLLYPTAEVAELRASELAAVFGNTYGVVARYIVTH